MNTSADKPEIVVASSADAAILSELSTRTYIAAFGADMTPEDLGAHVERVLSVDAWRAFLVPRTARL